MMEENNYDAGVRFRASQQSVIDELPNQRRLDLLHNINPGLRKDMDVLKSWIKFYRNLNIPFVVKRHETKEGNVRLVLWKELRI